MSRLAVRYGFVAGKNSLKQIEHLPLTMEKIMGCQHTMVSHPKMYRIKSDHQHLSLREIYGSIATPYHKQMKELCDALSTCGVKPEKMDWHVVVLE